ncbi:MAG: DNA polymerase III subunit delta [Candidatus Omnitrophica bacterium]|nr:DNA polymerase III subunit delta [Candidatus Omnitrophota bacterium]MCM8791009.1 DNA polymerase III subunit delta [Candidatus Omnitrophota bacterium]
MVEAVRASGSSVFLFIGEDRFLKEKAIQELVASFAGGDSIGTDYKVFHGADTNPEDLLDYINTAPFFTEKKIAIVKNAESLPSTLKTGLINYIKKPAPFTCLVLDAADDSFIKPYHEVARYMNIRYFGDMTGRELVCWMNDFLGSLGKSIDADAVSILTELHGTDMLMLAQELEKLAAFAGKRRSITAADVEEVAGRSLTRSAFAITRAIDKRKTAEAMRICSELVKSGKKEFEIIGLLCWHFKRMMRAKILHSKGVGYYAIAEALKIAKRDQNEFFKQLSAMRIADIKSKITFLLEADLEIKKTKTDPRLVLDLAVIRLCLG